MAKKKQEPATTWSGRMKELGGGNFTFLSSDGEAIVFIVVGLPVPLKSKYQGKEGERIGCPVVTDEGYMLFVTGKRLARKLAKHEKIFGTHAIMIVRHGVEGDVNAKYEIIEIPEPETYKRLHDISASDFEPSMIGESVEEALAVMSN
ncbi:hypothetical protein ES705_16310 [subsurface metagenome]